MSDSPPDDTTSPLAPSWLPLKAAAERLGMSPAGLLKRIRRGQLQAQRDNHGKWLVQVEALSEADKNKRPRTVRSDKTVADLRAQIAELEAERDRLVRDAGAAGAATAAALAKAEQRVTELSGSIRQLSETLSEALSEAKAREARALSEADKMWAWAKSEADKAQAETAEARRLIAEFQALPWWRRLLGRW
jgi:DNA repair exonuclease SbcCD ATPase subunit